MYKKYVNINGIAVIMDEKGVQHTREYRENIGKILSTENEITQIKLLLKDDQEAYENKKQTRKRIIDSYKKIVFKINVASVIVSFFCSIIFLWLFDMNVDGGFVELFKSFLINFSFSLVITLVCSNILAVFDLIFCPSLSELDGYEEMIAYEKELLKEKEMYLNRLNLGISCYVKLNNQNDLIVKEINNDGFSFINESKKLRYSFGKHRDVFMMYDLNKLRNDLNKQDYSSRAIERFVSFVEYEQKLQLTSNVFKKIN